MQDKMLWHTSAWLTWLGRFVQAALAADKPVTQSLEGIDACQDACMIMLAFQISIGSLKADPPGHIEEK